MQHACYAQSRPVSWQPAQASEGFSIPLLKTVLLYIEAGRSGVPRCGAEEAHAYLDELQAESSYRQLSERGERENGRVDSVADGVIEAGDLQAFQAPHQG